MISIKKIKNKFKNKKFKQKNNKYTIFFKIKLYFFVSISFISLLLGIFSYKFDNQILPTIIAISEKYAVNKINQEIDTNVEKTINEMGLFSHNFLKSNPDKYIDINTMLINNVCLNISKNLSENLKKVTETKIQFPIGMFFGINILSAKGFKINTSITSLGETNVDYETKFESVGINQINFQIYLNIKTKIAIVNPLYKKNINVSRKLMLVNTVFSGQVPNTYLDFKKNFDS